MHVRSTSWHIAALITLVGCSGSHTADECPDVLGTCMDSCCRSSGRPLFDAECNATCPAGTNLIDRCAPAPGCDGVCPPGDAALPSCRSGPCCDPSTFATLDPSTCSFSCPSGSSIECTPDPEACRASFASCVTPSDCVLAPVGSCCFDCAGLTLANVTAINGSRSAAYYQSICPEGIACPACVAPANPNLVPTCSDAEQCQVVDLRALPLSECAGDGECRLRATECCECGATVTEETIIAVRTDSEAAYTALVCHPGGEACDSCAPVYPTNLAAYCAPDGHCAVHTIL